MKLYQKFSEVADHYYNHGATYCDGLRITYTYKTLKRFVDQSAAGLAGLDHNPCYIIYLRKSVEIIVSQLALNKLGIIFVPIDYLTPVERVLEIANELQANIITDRNFSQHGYVSTIDNIWEWKSDLFFPDGVTHIIASSGSTGKPKLIYLHDSALIDVVEEQAWILGITYKSKCAWLLSPSFDASLSDIYTALLSGAQLIIFPQTLTKFHSVQDFLMVHNVTHADIPPSYLKFLDPKKLPNLTTVVFGGEIGNETLIRKWAKTVRMINAYGPTETTICSSMCPVDDSWAPNNIGSPLSMVKFHHEDDELIISGDIVCLGYHNTELNVSRFYEINGIRYYKTGDIVKEYNGNYYFMGRKDRQFKRNGILICPEELEDTAKLCGCDDSLIRVEENTVTLFYTGTIDISALRVKLSEKLPTTMMPTSIVKCEELPKTITGKIALNAG